MADSAAKALALAALAYKGEHASGNYPDIANKPKLNNITINGSHNSAYYKLPLLAETGHSINFVSDSEYNLTIELLNKAGEVISTSSVDLPLESMIMDGRYEEDSEGKGYLILTLENGHEIAIPLEGLIDELATKVYVDSLYNSEMTARIEADSELSARLDLETETRIDADLELQAHIDSEAEARILGDSELSNRIDTLTVLLDSEAQVRLEQDTIILNKLDSEATIREETDLYLEFLIDSEGRTREEQIRAFRQDFEAEVAARIAGDSELRADLNMEIFHRTQGDLDLQAKLNSEAALRANKDTEIENALGIEAQTRSAQDVALSNRINQKQDIITATTPIVKLGNVIQLNYDPETLSIEDNALTVIGGGGGTTAYLNGVLLDSEATSIDAKIYWYGTEEEYAALDSEAKMDPNTLFLVEGSEGRPISWTKSYYELEDKPQINGVTLSGDKSLASFGIQPTLTGTNPISVAGNTVSLRYNENQFFIGADNKLSFNDKDPSFDVSHMITFRAGFVGILGGMNCTKFNNGLYVGNLKFMNEGEVPTGDITIGAAFGDNGNTFNGYCIGFDESNHVPITFEVINGELHMYNNTVIPSRRYITVPFTFVL